jgi:hypothetical protein
MGGGWWSGALCLCKTLRCLFLDFRTFSSFPQPPPVPLSIFPFFLATYLGRGLMASRRNGFFLFLLIFWTPSMRPCSSCRCRTTILGGSTVFGCIKLTEDSQSKPCLSSLLNVHLWLEVKGPWPRVLHQRNTIPAVSTAVAMAETFSWTGWANSSLPRHVKKRGHFTGNKPQFSGLVHRKHIMSTWTMYLPYTHPAHCGNI